VSIFFIKRRKVTRKKHSTVATKLKGGNYGVLLGSISIPIPIKKIKATYYPLELDWREDLKC
jgi:hypothetical protein